MADPDTPIVPAFNYAETHFALAAVLLFLLNRADRSTLDLAEARLRRWNAGVAPTTFFNAMAVCLTAIVFNRSGEDHPGLRAVLNELLARTHEHRKAAFRQWAGNNVYLQQACVDTVLLPCARGQTVAETDLRELLQEFGRYRTAEGFYIDLPRTGTQREPLLPPTYIMKMLFLAGVCHELHPVGELEQLFQPGIEAALPLLAQSGTLSYFGRTDNSPFAAGLTIFNLRKAARLAGEQRAAIEAAADRAERSYRNHPRDHAGVLLPNRFADAMTRREFVHSKDGYAKTGEYALASCAYTLLACHWFPRQQPTSLASAPAGGTAARVASSRDLGVVVIAAPTHEIILRTTGEITAWDRRFHAPTILRYQVGEHLLVGAISRAVSTDRGVAPVRAKTRLGRAIAFFYDVFTRGAEPLDSTSVGYIPVLRSGTEDYLPYRLLASDISPSRVIARYQVLRVRVRGLHALYVEGSTILRSSIPGVKPKEYARPLTRPVERIEFTREIHLAAHRCRIVDRISGEIAGKSLLFSTRRFPGAVVQVTGLPHRGSLTGWGSDGRQVIDRYETSLGQSSIQYECLIAPA